MRQEVRKARNMGNDWNGKSFVNEKGEMSKPRHTVVHTMYDDNRAVNAVCEAELGTFGDEPLHEGETEHTHPGIITYQRACSLPLTERPKGPDQVLDVVKNMVDPRTLAHTHPLATEFNDPYKAQKAFKIPIPLLIGGAKDTTNPFKVNGMSDVLLAILSFIVNDIPFCSVVMFIGRFGEDMPLDDNMAMLPKKTNEVHAFVRNWISHDEQKTRIRSILFRKHQLLAQTMFRLVTLHTRKDPWRHMESDATLAYRPRCLIEHPRKQHALMGLVWTEHPGSVSLLEPRRPMSPPLGGGRLYKQTTSSYDLLTRIALEFDMLCQFSVTHVHSKLRPKEYSSNSILSARYGKQTTVSHFAKQMRSGSTDFTPWADDWEGNVVFNMNETTLDAAELEMLRGAALMGCRPEETEVRWKRSNDMSEWYYATVVPTIAWMSKTFEDVTGYPILSSKALSGLPRADDVNNSRSCSTLQCGDCTNNAFVQGLDEHCTELPLSDEDSADIRCNEIPNHHRGKTFRLWTEKEVSALVDTEEGVELVYETCSKIVKYMGLNSTAELDAHRSYLAMAPWGQHTKCLVEAAHQVVRRECLLAITSQLDPTHILDDSGEEEVEDSPQLKESSSDSSDSDESDDDSVASDDEWPIFDQGDFDIDWDDERDHGNRVYAEPLLMVSCYRTSTDTYDERWDDDIDESLSFRDNNVIAEMHYDRCSMEEIATAVHGRITPGELRMRLMGSPVGSYLLTTTVDDERKVKTSPVIEFSDMSTGRMVKSYRESRGMNRSHGGPLNSDRLFASGRPVMRQDLRFYETHEEYGFEEFTRRDYIDWTRLCYLMPDLTIGPDNQSHNGSNVVDRCAIWSEKYL